MAKSSGVKGDAFERDVAKFFNQMYKVSSFARSPGSGALVGKTNYKKKAGLSASAIHTMICDIITPDDFPYVVECKFYADKPIFHTLIKDKERTVDIWLGEVEFDAKNADKKPMLVFKTNGKGAHMMIPREGIDMSEVPYYVVYRDYYLFGIEYAHTIKDQIWTNSQ